MHKLYLLLLTFSIGILGCVTYNACRPMQVGMRWNENESFNVNIMEGNYNKTCEYKTVTAEGSYSYDCWYERK